MPTFIVIVDDCLCSVLNIPFPGHTCFNLIFAFDCQNDLNNKECNIMIVHFIPLVYASIIHIYFIEHELWANSNFDFELRS